MASDTSEVEEYLVAEAVSASAPISSVSWRSQRLPNWRWLGWRALAAVLGGLYLRLWMLHASRGGCAHLWRDRQEHPASRPVRNHRRQWRGSSYADPSARLSVFPGCVLPRLRLRQLHRRRVSANSVRASCLSVASGLCPAHRYSSCGVEYALAGDDVPFHGSLCVCSAYRIAHLRRNLSGALVVGTVSQECIRLMHCWRSRP